MLKHFFLLFFTPVGGRSEELRAAGFFDEGFANNHARQLGLCRGRSGASALASQNFFTHPNQMQPSYSNSFDGLGGLGRGHGASDRFSNSFWVFSGLGATDASQFRAAGASSDATFGGSRTMLYVSTAVSGLRSLLHHQGHFWLVSLMMLEDS